MNNKRILYFVIALITMTIGYWSRQISTKGSFLHDYVGDAIWAAMIYWVIKLLFLWRSNNWALKMAIVFSFAIEFTQMYHVPWIENWRKNPLITLIVGRGFLWSDLLMYVVGVSIAFIIDSYLFNNKQYSKWSLGN